MISSFLDGNKSNSSQVAFNKWSVKSGSPINLLIIYILKWITHFDTIGDTGLPPQKNSWHVKYYKESPASICHISYVYERKRVIWENERKRRRIQMPLNLRLTIFLVLLN